MSSNVGAYRSPTGAERSTPPVEGGSHHVKR